MGSPEPKQGTDDDFRIATGESDRALPGLPYPPLPGAGGETIGHAARSRSPPAPNAGHGLAITFVFMFAVGVVCAFGVERAPLLWLPACVAYFPLWTMLQIVIGRQGDAPVGTLDEWEIAQRNAARSIGLAVTQWLVMIPACYLIVGALITGGTDESMAYAGGLMTLTTLLIGGYLRD